MKRHKHHTGPTGRSHRTRKTAASRSTGRHQHRRLRLEQLEDRVLLAGDLGVRFAFADLTGNPVDFMVVGNNYELQAHVKDSRVAATGVAQAYFDVTYDLSLISTTGNIESGPEFLVASSGDLLTPGLINDAGGADTDTLPPQSPGVELLLFSIPVRASSSGTLNLVTGLAEPAERLPEFFQSQTSISLADIEFTGNSIEIRDPGISVSPSLGLQTTEGGGGDSFEISLRTTPTANVTVALSSSDPTEGTASPSSVTFTPANWNTPQVITLHGVDDTFVDGNIDYQIITAPAVSSDPIYNNHDPADVLATNFDNDSLGISVHPTTGQTTESGGTDTFQIVLNSEPTANVTIALSSSNTSEGTVSPTSVTLTPANWNVPQTIVVTGQDDNLADGSQAYLIITSNAVSDDTGYNGRTVADVSMTNVDDDSAGIIVQPTTGQTTETGGTDSFQIFLTSQPLADVTIQLTSSDTTEGTVSPSSITFSPTTWSSPQFITATGQDDDIADGNTSYSIVTSAAVSTDADYNDRAVADVAITNLDDDAAGILVEPTSGETDESGATATFSITLSSRPTADVTLALSSSDTTEGTVSPGSVTFTPATWNTPRQVLVTGQNDNQADGTVAYTIITAPAVSSDISYNGRNAADISMTNRDNDVAAAVVIPTTGLVTGENGATADFEIRLASQPTAEVSLSLTSSDPSEGTVAIGNVSFLPSNWNVPQIVTVTGIDDEIDDGDIPYTILTGNTVSDDIAYNNLAVDNVGITNTDNDEAGIIVSPTSGLETNESGGQTNVAIVLATQPTSDVPIQIVSSDPGEGTVDPGILVFTTTNWNQPRTVRVQGQDDAVVDGDVGYEVSAAPGSTDDNKYNVLAPVTVSVVNRDNDTASLVITGGEDLTTGEDGTSATFSVALSAQPTSDVQVTLASTDETEGTTSTNQLTFTSSNWSTPQDVSVLGVDDQAVDGNKSFSIVLTPASTDTHFDSIPPISIFATNRDNDSAQLTISTVNSTVIEGTGDTATPITFEITLTGEVENGMTVAFTTDDGTATASGGDYIDNDGTIGFIGTAGETHSIEIGIVADNMLEPDESFSVSLGQLSNISPDAAERIDTTATPLAFTITDDDETSISFFGVTLEEGTGDTPSTFVFDVTLSNPVQGGLRIEYTTNDGTATLVDNDYVDNDGTIEFSGTEGELQSIQVLVVADGAVEYDESFVVELTNIQFLDPVLDESIDVQGGTQTGTIVNDDLASVSFTDNSSLAIESTGSHTLQTRLSVTGGGTLTEEVTVELSMLPGNTATTPEDFVLETSTIVFPAGSRDGAIGSIVMNIVTDDAREDDEQVGFELSLVSGGMDGQVTLGTPAQHEVTISEDPLTASLSGTVWFDSNNNGVIEEGELPIPGVQVQLAGINLWGDVVEITVMTDDRGVYLFDRLPAGSYSVSENQPAAFIDGVDVLGTVNGLPTGQVEEDRFSGITLTAAQQARDYLFGEQRLALLHMSRRLFFASTPSLAGAIRDVVANGEQLTGDPTFADVIRRGEPIEMRRFGNTVWLSGTKQDDTFRFVPAGSSASEVDSEHLVSVNGLEWHFDAKQVDTIIFDALCGNDSAELHDSANNDVLTANRDTAILGSSDFRIDAIAFELVEAVSSSGGSDTVAVEEADFILRLDGPWLEP